MPRPRLSAGQTVSWQFAGFTFVGKLVGFNYSRRHHNRSAIVRVSPAEYEKHLQAIDAWSNRQKMDADEELAAAIEDDDIIWVLSKSLTAVADDFQPPSEGAGPDENKTPEVAGRSIRKFKKAMSSRFSTGATHERWTYSVTRSALPLGSASKIARPLAFCCCVRT